MQHRNLPEQVLFLSAVLARNITAHRRDVNSLSEKSYIAAARILAFPASRRLYSKSIPTRLLI
jgi:hypothetical protein